jgi:uncharacterized protein YueI
LETTGKLAFNLSALFKLAGKFKGPQEVISNTELTNKLALSVHRQENFV